MATKKISGLPVVTAVTDATAKIPLVEAGVTSAITVDDLAADSAFAGRYRPQTEPIYADAAGGMYLISGAPSAGVFVSRRYAWFLDDSTTEAVGARFHIPTGWTSITLSVEWGVSAGPGDVDLQVTMYQAGDGTSLGSAAISTTDITLTAPSVNFMKRSTLVAGQAVTAGRDLAVRLHRFGGDAADTLAADMAVLSLDIVKVA
jgi:hypothetical protein